MPNGTHSLSIIDANNVNFQIYFEVRPNFIVTPAEGYAGTIITASGYGCPISDAANNYTVTITWEKVPHAGFVKTGIPIDATGSFQYQFNRLPYPGFYISVGVRKNPGDIAIVGFNAHLTTLPTLTLTPSSGPVGTVITMRGESFPIIGYNFTVSWENQIIGFFRF